MEIKRMICPKGLKNNPNQLIKSVEYITIHNTGNYAKTANALAHAKLLQGGTGSASWHYSVDKDDVYQSFEDYQRCWHAGDGNDGTGNATSIGIEICVNDAENFVKTCDNAAQLVALLLKAHNLPIERVVQHNKWTGKDCPKEIRSGDWGINWEGFISLVKGYSTGATAETHPIIGKPTATVEQARAWAKSKNATDFFVSLASMFWEVATAAGVNPIVVYCQSARETKFGKFGGDVKIEQNNFAGIGATAKGVCGNSFATPKQGIEAQVDHIALYAGANGYPKNNTQDPRHYASILGKAKTVEQLSNTWAEDTSYGEGIIMMMNEVKDTVAKEEVPNEKPQAVVPDWQEEAFKKLVELGKIKSPEYWEKKLDKPPTNGELFAILANF